MIVSYAFLSEEITLSKTACIWFHIVFFPLKNLNRSQSEFRKGRYFVIAFAWLCHCTHFKWKIVIKVMMPFTICHQISLRGAFYAVVLVWFSQLHKIGSLITSHLQIKRNKFNYYTISDLFLIQQLKMSLIFTIICKRTRHFISRAAVMCEASWMR